MTINLPTEIQKARKKLYVIAENETIFVLADCNVTGGMMKVPMTPAQFQSWQLQDNLMQDIFPELNSEARELLITGLTPPEWNEIFGGKKYKKKELIEKFFYHFED